MKKNKFKNINFIWLITISLIICYIICNGFEFDKEDKSLVTEKQNDIQLFKSEYEDKNNLTSDDAVYLDLEIDEELIIYYKTDEEIIDILNNEKALIYFGFSDCPWCRNIMSSLVKAAVDNNEVIYYVDIQNIRNTYIIEDGLIVESVTGTDAYYEILDILEDNLSDYKITSGKKEYDTYTKRLYGPTVITINKGIVYDIYVGSLEEVEDPYSELNEEQSLELYKIYDEMIKELNTEVCDLDKC